MGSFDLDAARAAREEARGKSRHTVTFGGKKFTLPPDPPWLLIEAMAAVQQKASGVLTIYVAAIEELLGDQYEAFRELKPSRDDMSDLVNAALAMYEDEPGESPASVSSSARRSRSSRPTSNGSTH